MIGFLKLINKIISIKYQEIMDKNLVLRIKKAEQFPARH